MCKHISKLTRPSNTRISTRVIPPGVTKGFIKGEALTLLRTNSFQFSFEENMSNFKTCLQNVVSQVQTTHWQGLPSQEDDELAIQPLRRWFWCTKQQRIKLLLAVCQYDMNIQLNLFWRASSWGTSYQSPVFTVIMIVMLNKLIFFLNLIFFLIGVLRELTTGFFH